MAEKPPKISQQEQKPIPEVEELFEPFQKIIKQLKPEIERGEFSVIVGDDASGRIPARIMWEFINRINDRKKEKHLELFFVAGGGGAPKIPLLKDFWEKTKQQKPEAFKKTILIVTDTVSSGSTLYPVIESLKEVDLKTKIATIGILNSDSEHLESPIVAGEEYYSPGIYGRRELAGVYKDRRDLFSKRWKDEAGGGGHEEEVQESVNQARASASKVVDRLVEWYEQGK